MRCWRSGIVFTAMGGTPADYTAPWKRLNTGACLRELVRDKAEKIFVHRRLEKDAVETPNDIKISRGYRQ
jgi:hypothetical protein